MISIIKRGFLFMLLLIPLRLAAQDTAKQVLWQLMAEGKYKNALEHCNQLLEQNNDDYYLYMVKGRVLEHLYDYSGSKTALERADELNHENPEILLPLGTLYLNSGQSTIAVEVFEQLVNMDSSNINWRMKYAIAFQAAGLPKAAIPEFSWLMTMDSDNWLVYKYLGDCYLQIDSLRTASACYKKALELNPSNLTLATQLAGLS